MNKYLFIAIIVLIGVCATLFQINSNLRDEKNRLKGNQEALLKDVELYKTEAGKSAASVRKLELTYDELEDNYQDICRTAKDLDIKVKRMQAASKTATKTEVKIQTIVKDSIIYRDTTFLKIQTLKWQDPWISVKGNIYPDRKLDMTVESKDTITQIIHKVPKKFLFFKWGCKAIRQEIVSSNPHNIIVYSKYIELK